MNDVLIFGRQTLFRYFVYKNKENKLFQFKLMNLMKEVYYLNDVW